MTRRRGSRGTSSETPNRTELLGRVERRVEHFAETRDTAALLEAEAETDAQELLQLVGWDPADGGATLDAEAVLAAAWLIWLRSSIPDVSPEERERDIATSIALFTPLHELDPDLLPPQLRSLLDAEQAGKPITGADYYAEYRRSGDPAALDEAIQLIRGVASMTRADEPLLPGHLSDLSAALQDRFRLGGEMTDIEEAVDAGEGALAAAGAVVAAGR